MSVGAVVKRSFIGLGDAAVKALLSHVVTEEKGSQYFHGILSPSIRHRARSLVRRERGPLLEIGCGDGRFVVPVARERGRRVVGLDLFESPFCMAVKQRKDQGIDNLDLLRASGMELPFASESFGAVVCVNTLNSMPHKEAARAIVREMARVCRPGGCLLVDYRNEHNPIVRCRFKWRRTKYPTSSLHQIAFKDSDMVRYFSELGCRVDCRASLLIPFRPLAPALVLRARKHHGTS